MRIITCAGFFATGSSAVTDYFSEFDNVSSLGRYEYRFVQDPDGVADLEYNIVENNHRHNTTYAIKRYLKLIKSYKSFGYGGSYDMYGKEFDALTKKYIDDISELQTKTWWHRDRVDKGELFCVVDRGYSLAKRVLTHGLHNEKKYSLLTNREDAYYSAISEEQFLESTRNYTEAVVASANTGGGDFVMVDQLVPATNLNRYIRYFNDIKVVVVERDPRDVYLWERTRIHWGVIPTENVEEYVKWYEITRRYSHPTDDDPERVLRIQFEDIIYNYDETTKKLREFVGLSEDMHKHPLSKLVPERSKLNTNLKTRVSGFEKEIAYIEEHLQPYLYNFPED